MKVKRNELTKLTQAFNNVKDLSGIKFAYAITKNKRKIQQELDTLKEIFKPIAEYDKYEQDRVKLCNELCDKDENNNPVIKNNQFVGLEKNEDFNKKVKILQETYKSAIEERENQIKEYNTLMSEEVEIELHKVKLVDVPQNISSKQLESIFVIIDEE